MATDRDPDAAGWIGGGGFIADLARGPHYRAPRARLKRMNRRALKAYIRELEKIITDAKIEAPPTNPVELPEVSVRRGGLPFPLTVSVPLAENLTELLRARLKEAGVGDADSYTGAMDDTPLLGEKP